ncbi:helix-turn-helix domain-containing protein, partial [Sphingomonas olei]
MADDRGPEIGSAEVAKRMAVLRPYLIDGAPLARVATDAGIPIRTARRWIARYRADGPAGLARPRRPEAG